MKIYRLSYFAMAGLMTLASCDDVNKMEPASGNLTYDQVQKSKELVPPAPRLHSRQCSP